MVKDRHCHNKHNNKKEGNLRPFRDLSSGQMIPSDDSIMNDKQYVTILSNILFVCSITQDTWHNTHVLLIIWW